jgi:RNA polymerase sigma-B factor
MGHAIAAPAAEGVHWTFRLRAAADRRLFVRYREDGDLVARRELFERFMPLAHRLAHRYGWHRDQIDDLVQVASVGLVKAIDRFDHERGVAFTSYAVPTIVGELKRHLRDTGWALHVPQRMQERALEVGRAADDLRTRLGRSPTTEEVAGQVGLTADAVAEAVEAASAFETVPLDRPRDDDEQGPGEGTLLAFEDHRFDLVEYEATIAPALAALPPRERLILRMRFDQDMTQTEIGERLGMSQMHVSRLLRRALGRLRTVASTRQMV